MISCDVSVARDYWTDKLTYTTSPYYCRPSRDLVYNVSDLEDKYHTGAGRGGGGGRYFTKYKHLTNQASYMGRVGKRRWRTGGERGDIMWAVIIIACIALQ